MLYEGNTNQRTTIATLGRYRLLRQIGTGGMGDVWLCEDPRLHRQVAIKTLPSHSQHDDEFSLRFEREAQAAAALNHPHILPIHDYGKQPMPDGQVISYIVMPYISGGSLTDRIAAYTNRNSLMPPGEAVTFLSQAAQAIDYAHEQGIIHRDIKPANMLLRSDNWLLLADFGIARILSHAQPLTQTGVGFGTPEYMAPEQGQGQAVAASDTYSLAVLAYQLFTGRLPFHADTAYSLTIQHITMPPPPPRQLNPAIPPACEELLLRGLAKQPAQRPPSAHAFVAELERILQNSPFEATRIVPSQPQHNLATSNYGPTPVLPDQHTWIETASDSGSRQGLPAAPSAISRRHILIGGAALVLLGGGLGAWALASNANNTKINVTPTTKQTSPSTPTFDPNAPDIILRKHVQPITSLAWSSSQKNMLASASADGDVMLWDFQQIQPGQTSSPDPVAKKEFKTHGSMLLAWSHDGKYLAIGNTGRGKLFKSASVDIYTGALRQTGTGYDQPIIVPDILAIDGLTWEGNYIITVTTPVPLIPKKQFRLGIWDSTLPRQRLAPILIDGSLSNSSQGKPPVVIGSPNGKAIAFAETDGVVVGQASITGQTLLWRQNGNILKAGGDHLTSSQVDAITWSPGGGAIGAISTEAGTGTTLTFWDLQDSTHTLQMHTNEVLTTIAWSPTLTSALVATGSKDGKVLIWNLDKGQIPIAFLSGSVNTEVQTLAWSFDGQWLAAGYKDNDASIFIWKIQGRGF